MTSQLGLDPHSFMFFLKGVYNIVQLKVALQKTMGPKSLPWV